MANRKAESKQRVSDKERHRRHTAIVTKRDKAASQAGRDIGPPPDIKNVRRRNQCRNSLRLFCETYGSEACYWLWSADHLQVLSAIEQSIFHGAMLAIAMPRGSGKTTLCRLAVLWAVAFGHVSYVFLIGANEEKAVANLDAIKLWMRELQPFVNDFPEISHGVRALGGIANRANGQLCDGEPTLIRWEKTRIVLPRVCKPKNMRWHQGRCAPTSGIIIGVSGLTGEGIRGSLFGHSDGRQVRPDFVLLDDPQTDESARSRQQNVDRLALIRGAVLGMAGPGKRLSAVMPCTVIQRGDMIDQVLNRKKFPLWRGIRTSLLRSVPSGTGAWEKYFAIYCDCMGRDVPDCRPANAYYLEHREELDMGAEASWEARRGADEISAIQHAMNLFIERGEEAWFAEFQNSPLNKDEKKPLYLSADQIAVKTTGLDRGIVPKTCQHVTAYVDVHERLLYYLVAAWTDEFGGGPVDYGTYPRQPVSYFAQGTAPIGMRDAHPGLTEDAWILAGLGQVVGSLLNSQYKREDGALLRIGRLLIDAKWGQKSELIKQFCRRHPQGGSIVLPAMGIGLGPTRKTFADYRPEAGATIGLNWRLATQADGHRVVSVDVNWWKTLAAERLGMPLGTPGGWELFGRQPKEHSLFADHCVAEEAKTLLHKETQRERTVWEWKPGRPDNHYWDCLIGAAVACSMLGARPAGMEPVRARPSPRERPTMAELKAKRSG